MTPDDYGNIRLEAPLGGPDVADRVAESQGIAVDLVVDEGVLGVELDGS